jgi:glycosyltransferase involved in cell wall biosynthesis
MIVKNESANLADALDGFSSFADEIIVVDTGSKDNTKEIAAKFTPGVYDFEWIDDFSAARNFAMSKASKSYQLWLDADDRITPENGGRIEALKRQFDGRKAFYFILENHRPDIPPSSCLQMRCTPIIPGIGFEGRVHEQIFPSAARMGLELTTADIVVRHMGYMSEEARVAKAIRNLAIMEKEKAEGRDDGALHFFMAVTYGPLGKRREAIHSMESALECFEKENYNHHLIPEGYLFLAKVSFELEDYDRCIRCLARVEGLVESSPQHNFLMGILYQKMGKHREALRVLGKLFGQDYAPILYPTEPLPTHTELLLHMAYSLHGLNERAKALELINASAREKTDIPKSWEWLGTKAFALKNMELAAVAFETALRLGRIEPASWENLAAVYRSKGFSRKAEECMMHAGI